jgi:dipeptidyl aminopeptidase/acylaminoacyl peptidase
MPRLCLILPATLALSWIAYAQKAPFDAESLWKLARISDPQVSPDGQKVAFSVTQPDAAANRKANRIYVVPIGGGTPKEVGNIGDSNERPRWSPDGKKLTFTSDKGGSSQIWIIDSDGSNARQITTLSTEASGQLYSPDGKNLVFVSEVFPECGADDACNKKSLEALKNSPTKARIYDSLLYRHWTQWRGPRRSHLLFMPIDGGPARDLTPGTREVPPFSLGGPDDYAFAPDGRELCYATVNDEVPAASTNSDLFAVTLDGDFKTTQITTNPGADNSPLYSPDGKYLAYRSQLRSGYESDRFRLILLERATGKVTVLTDLLDRWVNSFVWEPGSKLIFFTTEDRGRQAIQFLPIDGGGSKVAISGDNTLDDMQFTPDGKTIVFTRQSGAAPVEICTASSKGGPPTVLTHFNDGILNSHQLTAYEELWTRGSEDAQVQSFIVKPPGFDPATKYPVLLLIHGGPQGAWSQSWSYRWNAQVFASAGYVVVMPNPRGSTGYGQKFIDDVNSDWGGRAYQDIMAVTDQVAALPYVDPNRMTAAGGSYGGYMIDWILGHENRFKALVSHAGVYDLRSEAGATEELWFPKWEFGGMPWDSPEIYNKWSPSLFASEFKTPTLVIHGELDFRVPYTQGLQLFTALQMQKVPSKLLIFPDEGHWVLKPQNSLLWYKTFIDWINNWTKK